LTIVNNEIPIWAFTVRGNLLTMLPAASRLYMEILEEDLTKRGATDIEVKCAGFNKFSVKCRHPRMGKD
jgi:nucleoid DNA-binding protein